MSVDILSAAAQLLEMLNDECQELTCKIIGFLMEYTHEKMASRKRETSEKIKNLCTVYISIKR